MRFIFFLSVILLLTACNNNAKKKAIDSTDTIVTDKPIPPNIPDTIFTGLGTEPFWAVYVIGDEKIVFEPADGPISERNLNSTDSSSPGIIKYFASGTISSITLTIKKENCSDGMSEEVYPYSVDLDVGGVKYKGCGRKKN